MPDPWGAAWFNLSSGAVVSGRQIPVGALFQHMCPADVRPLQLTVHFSQRYPDEACPYVAACRHKQHLIFNPRHMYFNNLKEALLIRTGVQPLNSQLAAPFVCCKEWCMPIKQDPTQTFSLRCP